MGRYTVIVIQCVLFVSKAFPAKKAFVVES